VRVCVCVCVRVYVCVCACVCVLHDHTKRCLPEREKETVHKLKWFTEIPFPDFEALLVQGGEDA